MQVGREIVSCYKNKLKILLTGIAILLLLMNCAGAAILIVGPGETYTTISSAIAAASSGDTIEVHSGTYNENVLVSKTLTLQGVGSPVVDAGGSGDAIGLTADGCTIRGFVVKNSSSFGIAAMSGGNIISGNIASGNLQGGIQLALGSGNTVSNNTVTGNDGFGISIQQSSSNTLSGNTVISNFDTGIAIIQSSGNTVSDNTVTGNIGGGVVIMASGNTLSNNTINGNGAFGIVLMSSIGNTIYLNTFNNANNAASDGADGANTWNSPTQIVWGGVTTYVGNRWSDYKGRDGNGDCIGDTPYDNITAGSEKDYYPIVCDHPSECNLTLTKTADKPAAHRGEEITYNIALSSCPDGVIYTNVTVWDILPKGVELVSVSPASSSSSPTNLTWDVGTLGPGQHFEATIVVRVPIVDINYDMAHDVQGEGFVNVHNDYDTHQGPESVTNCAYARADLIETMSSCATTGIVDPGTELERREFGSGTYDSEELTRIRTENKSIKTVTSLSAVHKPTVFSLPQGRSIGYSTKWTEKSKGKNVITGATMNEEYTSATSIEKNRSIELDKNGSTMRTEVQFVGQGHIGTLKKESPDAHPQVKPIFESVEDYVGSFKVSEMVDEYGKSVQSNRSVAGYGYVAVDQRVRDSQRTYESGTGSYDSEEIIDTPTNYIAKNVNLAHGPTNYSYTPDVAVTQNMLWTEGMWSKNGVLQGGDIFKNSSNCGLPATRTYSGSPPASYISERYSSIGYLKKESFALGLNEMNTNVSFNGIADYRVKSVVDNRANKIDSEELYAGQYNITRKVLITGVARYDRPHITVTKEGNLTTKWFNKTNANVAEYLITITNDGSNSLAPINVRDIFPPGTEYISSSIRPSSLSGGSANWTLMHLGIGDSATIQMTLNITDYAPGNIVNRVLVCGMKGDSCISAAAYSAIESDAMTCCPPEVFVDKTAKLDDLDSTLVHYTIALKNNAPNTIAATVTDKLPAGMSLQKASPEPNVDGGLLMEWVIADLGPGEIGTIEYDVKAAMDGTYVNTAHVDAVSVDGTGYATKDASARIDITSTGVAPKTTRYGGWQVPDWNMTSPDEGITIDLSPEEDLV